MKQRLIVVGPLPPPYHGVTVSTSLVLANKVLRERFEVEHLNTSDHRSAENMSRWDLTNIALGLRSLQALRRHLKERPGVIYLPISQGPGGFLRDSLFIHAAARRGWKVAAHLRGSDFKNFYLDSPPPLRSWVRLTLARVESVAVMGSSLSWIFDGLMPADKIAVVPNGTPEPNLDGVARDENKVLFLSNLRRRKGVVEAVDAALLVVRERPLARFLFVGTWEDEELERTLRKRAESVGNRIAFLSPVAWADRDRLFASCSVFLFPPTEPEGHPRVVLEAIAAGLPVVTTDRGAIAETVIDGQSGCVLPEPSPKAVAEKILRLLSDRELHSRMSVAARTRYLERFTQDHADRRIADWLSEVASNEQRPG